MKNIILRVARAEDYKFIYEVNNNAFGQKAEAELISLLKKRTDFIPELSLIAIADHQIVGHILFSKIKISNELNQSYECLALAPMAISSEYQRKGIGIQLVNFGLIKAKELGFDSVIVLGHDYYPKFGFLPASEWNIKAPFEVPDNVFMALELIKGSLSNVNGTVHYPEEFSVV